MDRYEPPELTPELVQKRKKWIALREARLDQKKKMYEDLYPLTRPGTNLRRLNDLEAAEFMLEIYRWELDGIIDSMEEDEELPED